MEESKEREEVLDAGILSPEDLAYVLGVTVKTIIRYISRGRIPAYRVVDGKYLISTSQLIRHIEKNALNV